MLQMKFKNVVVQQMIATIHSKLWGHVLMKQTESCLSIIE